MCGHFGLAYRARVFQGGREVPARLQLPGMFPWPGHAQLVPKRSKPSDMAVDQFLMDGLGIRSLYKGDHRRTECAAAVHDPAPDLACFPGAVVRAVVLETEVEGHCDTDDTDRLPRHGERRVQRVNGQVHGKGIRQPEQEWLPGPVEGHQEAVVPVHIHRCRIGRGSAKVMKGRAGPRPYPRKEPRSRTGYAPSSTCTVGMRTISKVAEANCTLPWVANMRWPMSSFNRCLVLRRFL